MTSGAPSEAAVLQMVRAEIDVHELHRWMGSRRLQDLDHATHCLLIECFGRDLAPSPFRLITPSDGAKGVLYGYGCGDADALREAAAICADPLQSRIVPADGLDSKPMPTQWQVGKQIGFEVRLRPVARRAIEEAHRNHRDIDVFQAEAERHPKGEMKRSRQQVYTEWLSHQLDKRRGACLDLTRVQLVSFQRTRVFRMAQSPRYSEGPDAVVRGVLTVTDPEAFAALLARGVGRHRAYGYGMLLLRPAPRQASQ